jgi:anti-sigma factor RsiW
MANVLRRARRRADHRWTPSRVSDYIDDELVPRSRARIERHFAECPECSRLLDDMGRMLGLLHDQQAAGPPSPTPEIAVAVRARLRE